MAGLAGVLANIPGLAGWEAGNQMGQQNQANQLRQVQGVMGLQQALQAQAEKQRASQIEQQFRAEIANAKTPEEQLKVASKYMGPDALGRMVQGSQDKQAQIAATREATMARLQQAANQFEANWQLRMRAATTQEERLALERQRAAFTQSLQSEAARLAGAQANYNFGFLPNTPPAPTVQAPQAAPTGQTVQGQFGDISVNLQNASPALMAAARAQPEAQGSPELMTALGGAPAAPTQAPRPAPQPAPVPQPNPAPKPAPTAAPSDLPPEIAALPLKDQNKWRMDELKRRTELRTTLDKNVQGLGSALEKANIIESNSVLGAVENALAKNKNLAEYLAGPKSTIPDMALDAIPGLTNASEIKAGRQAFQKLFNITLKNRSGAAVTIPEFERLKAEFASGMWKTPEQIATGVAQARKIVEDHYKGIAASFGPQAVAAYNANLAALGGSPVMPTAPTASNTPASPKRIKFDANGNPVQ